MRENTIRQGERTYVNFYQNDQFTWRVVLQDYDGYAIDLTGVIPVLYAKIDLDDIDSYLEITGSIVGSAVNGMIDFPITLDNTASVRDLFAEISLETGADRETHQPFTLRILRDIG